MKVDLKAIKLGKSQLIVILAGKKYVKKALPEVINVLYAEAKKLYEAKHNSTALKKFIVRINPDYRITTDDGLFQRDDLDKYYLSGYPVEVPIPLLESIRSRIRADADYTHLIEFWKLLMINPNAGVRNHLFDLCNADNGGFEITSAGYLLGFVRCGLNHNVKSLEGYLRGLHKRKATRDDEVYLRTNGMYGPNNYNSVAIGTVRNLYRDLFKDEFSKVREGQSTVFRTQGDLGKQLQIGQITQNKISVHGSIQREEELTLKDIIVMVMLNPANVESVRLTQKTQRDLPSSTLDVLECFPYGAVQRNPETKEFDVIGETLLEIDYMQQDFYNMTALLEEARGLVGGRTILLTPADIKKILDSRKVFINEPKKE